MGSIYLDGTSKPNLADVCRKATSKYGTKTVEVGSRSTEGDGWKRRSRGSGGYDVSSKPNHVIVHHTAGNSEGWQLANYLCFDHSDKPCANISLMSNGDVYVQAGGASNHAGAGYDPCSPDVTPEDSMNSHSIGIEASNLGTGETWPEIQLNVYVALVGELCLAYAIPVSRVHAHREWAPDRKIDPAGPPRYATGSKSWNMTQFRDDVQEYINTGGSVTPIPPDPTPEPPDTGDYDWMATLPTLKKGDSGAYVERMQHLLAAAGFMNEANVANYDGVWGNGTENAKVNFDNAHGLTPSPPTDCGPKSWESLMTGKKW
ncbi:MAG: N-acetylmuramoyl-L-alanine amidase [Paenisporosarcina sp.]